MLEPDAVKVARPVLRGRGYSNIILLPDHGDAIFGQWLNRDEATKSESVSVTNNIELTTPLIDTTSQLIRENTEVVSVTNNIVLPAQVADTTLHDIPQTVTQDEDEDTLVPGWKGLSLKLRQGLDSAGQFYQQLVSKVGEAVGVADGEPYTEWISGQVAGLG